MNIRTPCFILLLLLAPLLHAQTASTYIGENDVPRPIDVARALAGSHFKPHLRKRGLSIDGTDTRPIALGAVATTAGAPVATPSADSTEAPSESAGGTLDVAIGFALGSAELRPDAVAQLDAIAEGLKLLDADRVIVIDGHTDATGTPQFNELLSLRRAETVKQYLEHKHHLPASRLRTHGYGQRAPLDPGKPFDPRNRRVQFHLS